MSPKPSSGETVATLLGSKLALADPAFWGELRMASSVAVTVPEIIALSALRRRALRHEAARFAGEPANCYRVALIGGYTTYPLSELVSHLLATSQPAVTVELFLGDFDNYVAEIMDDESALIAFKPDVLIILPSVLRCRYSGLLTDAAEVQRRQAEETANDILHLASLANQNTGARVILGNFPLASGIDPGPFRVRSMGTDWSFRKLVNLSIGAGAPNFVTICDLEFISARLGVANATDDRAWFESKQLGSSEFLVDVGREIAHLIVAPLRTPIKVVVLDLDNTLWGGVIGDDGIDGIVLGDTDAVGEAYKAFQQHLRSLKARGLLLAVSSKNEHDIAVNAFRTHPEMVISLDDIVSFKANWGPKPDSIREIAQELGLGLDSFVFIDDNPAEIEHVRQALPEVHGILLDEDPAKRCQQLRDSRLFEIRALTEEDAQRNAQYQAAAQRQASQSETHSFEDYLLSLAMTGELNAFRSADVVRIAQLISRSNQFNLTTIRRHETELMEIMADPSVLPFTIRLRDRFGDYGLIAVVVGRIAGAELVVDTWLMSCRVLKRQVEEEVVNELLRLASAHRLTHIRGVFVPTAKNGIVRDLYATLGFRCVLDEAQRREFLLEVAGTKPFSTHIKMHNLSVLTQASGVADGATTQLALAPIAASVLPAQAEKNVDAAIALDVQGDAAGRNGCYAARPGVEAELAAIWSEVLNIPPPDREANFFDLGGDSLLAMQVHFLLQDRFPDKPLNVTDLIRFPTIAALGAVLGAPIDELAVPPAARARRTEAVYFGPKDRPLFGMFHRAEVTQPLGAVLFCYPLPPKYVLCYQGFLRLAVQLSQAGYDVLRFDYTGTGDSAGEAIESSLARWDEEVEAALVYLRSRSAAVHLSLLGMRLGAALAARASTIPGKIHNLIMWEPVIDGRDYVDELRTMRTAPLRAGGAPREGFDVHGFPFTAELQRELATLSLCATPLAATRMLIIESRERAASRTLETTVSNLRRETISGLEDWRAILNNNAVSLPPAQLRRILQFLTEP